LSISSDTSKIKGMAGPGSPFRLDRSAPRMIVQACLNGARSSDYHPALPLTSEAMARDAATCVAAGASELHVHPRGSDGHETLGAASVAETLLALRHSCPGTLIGVSTGDWIERNEVDTLAAISSWQVRPDYASVNLEEANAEAVMELLHRRGIGIEAGTGSIADVERLAASPVGRHVFRVLIEVSDQDIVQASAQVDDIAGALEQADIGRPLLLHGVNATVWPLVAMAAQRRWSTRVGLEDGRSLPDGTMAGSNSSMVAAAAAVFATRHRG
jgi:uncharacterized protein (DUF849 family)